ncbi:MAG: hypothetical protein ACI8RZ_003144 [Myxococcota bacterium]
MDETPTRKRDRLAVLAKTGARLAAIGLSRVVTRALWWGGWGLVLGGAIFAVLQFKGLLTHPWPDAEPWVSILAGVFYIVGAGVGLGYAGFWRGVGRFVIHLGVEEGWVIALTEAILDRMLGFFRRSRRLDAALDASELWAQNLPLQQWEEGLKSSVAAYLGEEDAALEGTRGPHRRFLGWIRRLICRGIEKILLRIVRKESSDAGGGGVSMERVREVALEMSGELFTDGVEGAMNKQLLIVLALVSLAAATPSALLHWLT